MNLVEATIEDDKVVFGQFRVPLDPARRLASAPLRRVVLGIRPEAFTAAEQASDSLPRLQVDVEVVEELGSDAHVFFPVDAPSITSEILEASDDQATLLADAKALFNARVSPGAAAAVGRRLSLAVDPARFHFFDASTGASLRAPQDSLAERPPEHVTPSPV
jgi:ABC-type sugar transport system ATPase subunit